VIAPRERSAVVADVARASGFLRAAVREARTPASTAYASLGLSICAFVAERGTAERAAAEGSRMLAAALARASSAELVRGDALAMSLACTFAGEYARDATIALRRRLFEDGAPSEPARSARQRTVACLLGAGDPMPPLLPSDDLANTLLGADDDAAREACDRIEAYGLTGVPYDSRRRIGIALAARAFAALRGSPRFDVATHALRALCAERLDERAVHDALQFLRRQQRVDGAYGNLPLATRHGDDLRESYHLPVTVLCVWAIHDMLLPDGLIRRALDLLRPKTKQ
jgi:hypothetical protein